MESAWHIIRIAIPAGFGLVGLLILGLFLVSRAKAARRRYWPAVQGTMVSAGLELIPEIKRRIHDGGRRPPSYLVKVRYRYRVAGESLEGKVISFAYEHMGFEKFTAQAAVDRYGPGTRVRVFYNPTNPTEACLEPGKGNTRALAGAIFCIVASVVIGGVFYAIENLDFDPQPVTDRDTGAESSEQILARLDREAEAELKRQERKGQPARSAPTAADAPKAKDALATHLAAGRSIDERDDSGNTQLHWAARHGEEEQVRVLLAKGARVDIADSKMRTPLHLAAREGWDQVVRILLEAGADLSAKDAEGHTATDLAGLNGHARLQLRMKAFAESKAK